MQDRGMKKKGLQAKMPSMNRSSSMPTLLLSDIHQRFGVNVPQQLGMGMDERMPMRPPIRSTMLTMFLGGFGLQAFLTLVNMAVTRSARQLTKTPGKTFKECIQRGTFLMAWIAQFELLIKLYRTYAKFRQKRRRSADMRKAIVESRAAPRDRLPVAPPSPRETAAAAIHGGLDNFRDVWQIYDRDVRKPYAPRPIPRSMELLAAFVAGSSSSYAFGGFSWNLCLFFVMRGALAVWRKMLADSDENSFLRLLQKIPLPFYYGFVNSYNLYFCLYETRFLNSAYRRFAMTTGNIQPLQTKYMFRDTPPGAPFPPCQPTYHKGTCSQHLKHTFPREALQILRLYAAVFSTSRLVFSFPGYLKAPVKHFLLFVKQTVRSSLFLVVDFTLSKQSVCLTRLITPNHNPWLIHLVTYIAGLPIALENKGRQTELMLYMLWQVVQSVVYQYLDWGQGPHPHFTNKPSKNHFILKYAPSLLFGLASSLWVYGIRNAPQYMKSMDHFFVSRLFYQRDFVHPRSAEGRKARRLRKKTENKRIAKKPALPDIKARTSSYSTSSGDEDGDLSQHTDERSVSRSSSKSNLAKTGGKRMKKKVSFSDKISWDTVK